MARVKHTAPVHRFIGRRVAKTFGKHGTFFGKVNAYDEKKKWFHVVYDDGDEEEYTIKEIEEILSDEQQSPPQKPNSPQKQPHSSAIETPDKTTEEPIANTDSADAEEDEQQPVSPVAKKQKLTADAEKEQEKQDNCDGNAVNEVK
ncbi:histone-lysine N-methyltransferase, H3 lysine-9 specific [Pycnococcus provasolii]